LASGKSLTSTNGRFVAVMQGDGNLVIYGGGRALWGTRTHAPGSVLALQGDGNLVIYDSQGRAVWSTRTEGSGTTDQLIMQDDGNLVLYGARGAVWGTGSHA
jgi:hypothetical protein